MDQSRPLARLFWSNVPSIAALLCFAIFLTGCKDIVGGEAGQSFIVGDRFVVLSNGFRMGKVTYVVAQSWPASSTPDQRVASNRLTFTADGRAISLSTLR